MIQPSYHDTTCHNDNESKNRLCPKNTVAVYLLLAMSTIVFVLMSEVHMSAALHASDRPAKQQLSPNNAMQVPTNDTTIIP